MVGESKTDLGKSIYEKVRKRLSVSLQMQEKHSMRYTHMRPGPRYAMGEA